MGDIDDRPTPWTTGGPESANVYDDNGFEVASATVRSPSREETSVEQERAYAVARFIASAPQVAEEHGEMLALLRRLLVAVGDERDLARQPARDVADEARALVARIDERSRRG